MALNLEDIRQLFETWGSLSYSGEQVTQLDHALQSGSLAQEEGAGMSWYPLRSCTTSGIC